VLLLAMLCGVIWQAIGNIPKRARIAKQMYWQRNGFSASVDHAGHIESLTAMRNSDEALAAPGFDPIAALAELPDAPTIIINGPQADASIKQLAKCEAIRELKLAGSDVTDAGLASVAKMTGLESLDLSRTSVTNAGIAHLKSLPNLRHLNLANVNAITDEVAAHLATFPKLEWINLPQNAVTVESLDRLRRALPDVQIISRP
jgi:hypothetical protein